MRKTLRIVAALSALLLSACGGGHGGGNGTGNGNMSPTPLASFVIDLIRNQTTETALPVDINTLNLDTSSEDPDQFDSLFM